MKLKHIFSVVLISLSTASLAGAAISMSPVSMQALSKIKSGDPLICKMVLNGMSEGCHKDYRDTSKQHDYPESICDDRKVLDNALRQLIVMYGVDYLCDGDSACKSALNQYMRQCPIL